MLDGNLHGQQASSIVRDPKKGKSPVTAEGLFLNNQKKNSQLHEFVLLGYFNVYYYYSKA